MDLEIIDGTLAGMTAHDLALTPRWVELWVRAGTMSQNEADEWVRRSCSWRAFRAADSSAAQ